MRLRRPFIYLRKGLVKTIYQQTCFVSIQNRFCALLCLFPAFISSQVSLVVLWQPFLSLLVFVFAFSEAFSQCSAVRSSCHSHFSIFLILLFTSRQIVQIYVTELIYYYTYIIYTYIHILCSNKQVVCSSRF